MDIYIGYDQREDAAYRVAEYTLREKASEPINIHKLESSELQDRRMLWRPISTWQGQIRDHLSNATQSTEFASSRFLTPLIHRKGWCLFCDCDVVFMDDVKRIFDYADDNYAVMVVKHNHVPKVDQKMDKQHQYSYPRKNWSSVVLWNCDHVANQRLDLGMVNWWPGILLHRFSWLRDEEIGELPRTCNWLVNEQEKPDNPIIAHFTLGGPWIDKWGIHDNDSIWNEAFERCSTGHSASN